MNQRRVAVVSLGVLAAVIIVGAVTFLRLNADRVVTGNASPGGTGGTSTVTTTQTVIEDSCEDLQVPCPPPDAGSAPPSGSAEPNVDALAEECFDGDMRACDDLYTVTANGEPPSPTPDLQPYFDYGYTCGHRLSVEEVNGRLCVDIYLSD